MLQPIDNLFSKDMGLCYTRSRSFRCLLIWLWVFIYPWAGHTFENKRWPLLHSFSLPLRVALAPVSPQEADQTTTKKGNPSTNCIERVAIYIFYSTCVPPLTPVYFWIENSVTFFEWVELSSSIPQANNIKYAIPRDIKCVYTTKISSWANDAMLFRWNYCIFLITILILWINIVSFKNSLSLLNFKLPKTNQKFIHVQ